MLNHPDYTKNENTPENDICLVKLKGNLTLDGVFVTSVPMDVSGSVEETVEHGFLYPVCYVAGWGRLYVSFFNTVPFHIM